jgi:hypothetical protein
MTVRDELCAAKTASAHPSFRPKFALIAARTISTLLQPGIRFWHRAAESWRCFEGLLPRAQPTHRVNHRQGGW